MSVHAGSPITVQICGEDYKLRFTLRVLKELKDDHSISLFTAQSELAELFTNPDKIAVVLCYGMRKERPDITVDWILDNVDLGELVAMAPSFAQAMNRRIGANPNGQPPTVNGTGTPSGQLAATISDSASPTSGT